MKPSSSRSCNVLRPKLFYIGPPNSIWKLAFLNVCCLDSTSCLPQTSNQQMSNSLAYSWCAKPVYKQELYSHETCNALLIQSFLLKCYIHSINEINKLVDYRAMNHCNEYFLTKVLSKLNIMYLRDRREKVMKHQFKLSPIQVSLIRHKLLSWHLKHLTWQWTGHSRPDQSSTLPLEYTVDLNTHSCHTWTSLCTCGSYRRKTIHWLIRCFFAIGSI